MERSLSRSGVVDASFVEVLRRGAHEAPQCRAYRFLDAQGDIASDLTYAQLDERARAVGALLQEYGVAGERAVLLFPPGEEYVVGFLGCLYGGAVAVPAYPPRQNRNLPRLLSILRDAQPAAILTTSDLMERLWRWGAEVPELTGVQLLATDERDEDEERAAAWCNPQSDPDALAFLQYTSGSTGTPKGVMVSHGNLVANSALIHEAFGTTEEDRLVSWLPPYHDMGLIGGILQPLFARFPATLMAPVAFLQQPALWLEVMTRERATISGAPNFAYDLAARRTSDEQRAQLDLSAWAVAFNGAEPVRAQTLQHFAETFAPHGFSPTAFYPCYGLAEATLFVSGGQRHTLPLVEGFDAEALGRDQALPMTAPPGGRSRGAAVLVSSGRGAAGQRLRVVDPETRRPLPAGSVGEVWVAGPSVTGGYWRRPEETAETFGAHLEGLAGETYLRTGDLGFLGGPGGDELFVTGRSKDLIIIRGRNHYPQDLERTAEKASDALRAGCGAAFSVGSVTREEAEAADQERLVIVYEVDRHSEAKTPEGAKRVMEAVHRAIAEEHEVAVHEVVLVRAATVPKTSSGKIQRRACRRQFRRGELTVVARDGESRSSGDEGGEDPDDAEGAPSSPSPRQSNLLTDLRREAARQLGLSASELSLDQPLTAAGLDSLAALELQRALQTRFGKTPHLAALLAGISLEELAAEMEAASPATEPAEPAESAQRVESLISDGPEPGRFPLSYGQRTLWQLDRRSVGEAACHCAVAVCVKGLEPERLQRALHRLSRRHPALRTTFGVEDGEPYQVVRETLEPDFQVEADHEGDDYLLRRRLSQQAYRPLDPELGPLIRMRVIPLEGGEHAVLLVVHQLVADRWSMAVLVQDLAAFYQEQTLPPLPLRYTDHVLAQRRRWETGQEPEPEYPAPLELPTDRPRPPVQTFTAGVARRRLRLGALRARVQRRGTTLFQALMAGYQALLHRYSGQRRLCVGTLHAQRPTPAAAAVVGWFGNPVAIVGDLGQDPSFGAFLEQVENTVREALARGDYPFSPLFQTLFAWQRAPGPGGAGLGALGLGQEGTRWRWGEGPELQAFPLRERRTHHDLTLLAVEDPQHSDGVVLALEYNDALFDHTTGERLLDQLAALLQAAVAEPDRWQQPLSRLPLLSDIERHQLVVRWNDTSVPYPDGVCLHELFEAQAAAAPEATALIWRQEHWSYQRLDGAATELAKELQQAGVGPEIPVAVLLPRSPRLLVALLAVLKAGGVCLPLDPAQAREEQRRILEAAAPPVLLTEAQTAISDVPDVPEGTVLRRLGTLSESTVPDPPPVPSPPLSTVGPNNLAYLLYRSDPEGSPLPVALEHRGPVALTSWARAAFAPEELAGVLATTAVTSSLSLFELFAPLAAGGTVILADEPRDLLRGEEGIAALAEITLLPTVPSILTDLVRHRKIPESVITVLLAGEPLPGLLADATYEAAAVHRVFHLDGATEHTAYSTGAVVPRPERRGGREPALGRPLPNAQVYVLDRHGEPVPVGMPGELYLTGAGLARGYLGRPGLTARRFVPDPFARGYSPGSRLYRTGDRVRYRPDGDLEYLGPVEF